MMKSFSLANHIYQHLAEPPLTSGPQSQCLESKVYDIERNRYLDARNFKAQSDTSRTLQKNHPLLVPDS